MTTEHNWATRRCLDSKTREPIGYAVRVASSSAEDGKWASVDMWIESFDGTLREKARPTRVVLRTYARDALTALPGRDDRDIILEEVK